MTFEERSAILNHAPKEEPARQFFFIERCKEIIAEKAAEKGSPLTACVNTFGCQMNAKDSEKLIGILKEIGYQEQLTEDADFVLYNTCTVREHANVRVYGRLGVLKKYKDENPDMIIALCGCMMQEEEVVAKIRQSYRHVDLIFGTHNIYKLAELLFHRFTEDSMQVEIMEAVEQTVENLPADYKIIHAGKSLSENLGYYGDDTGDNISRLNPYINELTALYWMWKNTSESIIGLSHYRRFFTSSNDEKNFMSYADRNFEYEKILTKEQAVNILRDFDIITTKPAHRHTIWYEDLNDDLELTDFALSTVRKHLMRVHPEYVDAFDYLVKTSYFYCKNMFVTRRYIFNAYCEWFFSFYLDATREVLNSDVYKKSADKPERLMGWLAERIQTVWLMKNHLRIKELFIIEKFDIA